MHVYLGQSEASLLTALKGLDDLISGEAQGFFGACHQITWNVKQGVRVSVKREEAGAKTGATQPGAPGVPAGSPQASPAGEEEGEEVLSSCIETVLHGSVR